jgi:uncharacterized protein YcfJ
MRKLAVVSVAALTLTGCQTVQQDRALTGAVIGGVAGTAIGAAAGGTGGAALAGAAIGAGTGAFIGAATTPRGCYVRDRYGNLRQVRCR